MGTFFDTYGLLQYEIEEKDNVGNITCVRCGTTNCRHAINNSRRQFYKTHIFHKYDMMKYEINPYKPKVGEKIIYFYGLKTKICIVKEVKEDCCLIGNKQISFNNILSFNKDHLLLIIRILLNEWRKISDGSALSTECTDKQYLKFRHKYMPKYHKTISKLIKQYRKIMNKHNKVLIRMINKLQKDSTTHPLTCGYDSTHNKLKPVTMNRKVVLVCPDCGYVQSIPHGIRNLNK